MRQTHVLTNGTTTHGNEGHVPSNSADWRHVNHYVDMMSRETRQNSNHPVEQRVMKMSDHTCQI